MKQQPYTTPGLLEKPKYDRQPSRMKQQPYTIPELLFKPAEFAVSHIYRLSLSLPRRDTLQTKHIQNIPDFHLSDL